MKYYHNPMSRAVTSHWMLLELGVPYEEVVIDFSQGENLQPEFLAVNPMGKVPALLDEGEVVTETAAICAYLADKFPEKGLAPASTSPLRGKYYRYLFFSGTCLEPMLSVLQYGDAKDYPASSVGWGDLERCLAAVEAMAPESGWALGDNFSAADIVFGGTLNFCVQFGWLTSPSTKVKNYVDRLRSRRCYKASHPEAWH